MPSGRRALERSRITVAEAIDLVDKSTCGSFRDPELGSQHPHDGLQPSGTPIPGGIRCPLLVSVGILHHTH